MRRMMKTLLATSCLGGAVILPASAQFIDPPDEDATVVVIDQFAFGDVFADMTINVAPDSTGAAAAATATGNTSTADIAGGDVDYDAVQTQNGTVTAYTALIGGPVSGGSADTVTTAYGNAASSSTHDGTTFHTATQNSNADVSAQSDIYLDGADAVTASTTAAANVSSYSNANGAISGFQTQTGSANVSSVTNADLCCNNTSVALASTASGNTVTSTGTTTTSYNDAVQTMDFGTSVRAETNAIVASGTSVGASATAAANSVTVHNEWGFASLGRESSVLYQGNGAETTAIATVDLGTWSGTSGATAYGVGNSALISNVGSDTYLYANQENLADIASYASFTGTTSDGSTGFVSSTAIGNAATATLCYTCGADSTLGGQTSQLNSANVSAYGSIITNGNGSVQGAATAIGNSATYQSFAD